MCTKCIYDVITKALTGYSPYLHYTSKYWDLLMYQLWVPYNRLWRNDKQVLKRHTFSLWPYGQAKLIYNLTNLSVYQNQVWNTTVFQKHVGGYITKNYNILISVKMKKLKSIRKCQLRHTKCVLKTLRFLQNVRLLSVIPLYLLSIVTLTIKSYREVNNC